MVSLGSANAWSRSVVQRSMPWRSASARSLSSLRPTRTGSGQIMRPSRVGTPPCSRMATIDRTRCWLVPMRPVTPFMITPSRILPAGSSGCLWAVRAGIVFTLRGHILSSAMADARRRSSRANVTISDVADPYFSEIVAGIQEVATAHRRLVVLCNSLRDPENELQYVQMLRGQRVDALILAGGAIEDATYLRQLRRQALGLKQQGARMVMCGRYSSVSTNAVVP